MPLENVMWHHFGWSTMVPHLGSGAKAQPLFCFELADLRCTDSGSDPQILWPWANDFAGPT